MAYMKRPSKSKYSFSQVPSTLSLLLEKKLISPSTFAAWSLLSAGGDRHVALQSTLVKRGFSEPSARKYVNELVHFGFLVPTKDPMFRGLLKNGRKIRAFDLVGTPDLSEWLTEEELESCERFVREEDTYTDDFFQREEEKKKLLYDRLISSERWPKFREFSEEDRESFVEMVLEDDELYQYYISA